MIVAEQLIVAAIVIGSAAYVVRSLRRSLTCHCPGASHCSASSAGPDSVPDQPFVSEESLVSGFVQNSCQYEPSPPEKPTCR